MVAILWEQENPRRVRLDDLVENAQQPILKQTEAELKEYFAGKRTEFTVPLDMRGTRFQRTGLGGAARNPIWRDPNLWAARQSTRKPADRHGPLARRTEEILSRLLRRAIV